MKLNLKNVSYIRIMRLPLSIILGTFALLVNAQPDYSQGLDPHYSRDSAYFCLDTIYFDIPANEVASRLKKALSSGSYIVWNKSDIALNGNTYSGRLEFMYEPDSLMDIKRMGYLSTYAEIKQMEDMCIIKLQQWLHQPAVSGMISQSIGPISRGNRCSKNLCTTLGVEKCSEICDLELWPALLESRTNFVEWIRNEINTK